MSLPKLQFKNSLTYTTLVKMTVRVAIVIIVVTIVSYWHVMSQLELQVTEQLKKYIIERGQRESILFQQIAKNHELFKQEFISRYLKMDKQYTLAQFQRMFEKRADGSTRMYSKYFSGIINQAGAAAVRDITGFISQNTNITESLRHRLAISAEMLNDYGPAWRDLNLYLITHEEGGALVGYWHGHPWSLELPADSVLTQDFEELYRLPKVAHNPQRKMICTKLYYDIAGKQFLVSCVTPFDVKDQLVASIGTDVLLNDLFKRSINDHLEGTYNTIFRADGELIVHPSINNQEHNNANTTTFNILQSGDPHLNRIFQLVKGMNSNQVIIDNAKDDEYLAVAKIEGPDWYFVTVYPKSLLAHLAFETAGFILILGLLSLSIEIVLLLFVLRNQIAKPLNYFLAATEQITQGNFNVQLDAMQPNELGRLARSFNSMAHEIDTREEGLKQVQESLLQANRIKDEFLANTSHELRTPLNGIIGIAESLLDGIAGNLSEKAKVNLTMIVGSGKRLTTLVNDILDFSKLKHKNLDLQLKPIGLREIVDIVLTLSHPLVLNKPIQLINIISPELPPAQADENRLQQILYNLIGNAIKFTESGTVEVSAQVAHSYLEIRISDTGIGIQEDKLDRIFEFFEQAEGSTARKYGGTGLGLALTKQLVQLHGGRIWVESQVNQGSQFYFTLPIAEGKSSQLSVTTLSEVHAIPLIEINDVTETLPDEPQAITEKQLKILIVDDEPVNLQVLNNFLSLQNYHILQATSGPEALAFIEEGFIPDAVLLDVMMPKMTGFEVTQQIREKWQADELPILLLTAKNQVADLVMGLESGASDYLTKPVSKDELLARLKTHLQLKGLKEETLHLALENERMKTELEVACRLQKMILPKEQEQDKVSNLEIAGFMEPAEEIGGDYYDILTHNGRILFGIGDVTGHGLESGMLMLMAQAGIRTLLENEERDYRKIFNSINGMIYKNAQERLEVDKNLTLSLLEYQPQEESGGILRISGRHEDIIVVRNGQLERIDTGDLGFQVGFVDDIAELVNQIEVPLHKGDVMVLYTDGITEAENPQREEYGIKRLCGVVKRNCQQSAKEIKQAIIEDVKQYIGEHKIFDDITVVVLKQK